MRARDAWVSAAAVLGLLASACGQGDSESSPCIGRSASAIYYGSPDPIGLALSEAQRRAIGGLQSGLGPGPDVCTATVIAEGWILTAAHCAVGTAMAFRFDSHAPSVPLGDMVFHPELDIMLAELDQEQTLDELRMEPISLWPGPIDEQWKGRRVTIAGVGQTENDAFGDLLFAEEPIVDVQENELWVDGMGQSGACVGDSGGPMLVRDARGVARIAGVLDRGSADCVGLDVYTKLDTFRDWIVTSQGGPPCAQR